MPNSSREGSFNVTKARCSFFRTDKRLAGFHQCSGHQEANSFPTQAKSDFTGESSIFGEPSLLRFVMCFVALHRLDCRARR